MVFICNFLMFFGFLFLMIIGLGQIIQNQKKEYIYVLFSFSFLGQGFFLLMLSIYASGLYPDSIRLILFLIPVAYIFTPLLILRYIWLFSLRYNKQKINLMMFLPALLAALYCSYGFFNSADIQLNGFMRPMVLITPSFFDTPPYWRGVYYLMAGAKLFLVLSLTPMLVKLFILWRKGRPGEHVTLLRIAYFFALMMDLTVLLSFIGDFVSISLVKASIILANIFICGVYIVSQKHPDYNRMLKIVIHKAKYAQSYIKGVDIDSIKNRLYEIMELEKAFADEDITLKSIAGELGVTTHQLSQLLNEKIMKNFNTFVNEFRVNEAKTLLVDEPERSILSISVAVGFNSYVTFCTVFSKMTGSSPSQFRKDKLNRK